MIILVHSFLLPSLSLSCGFFLRSKYSKRDFPAINIKTGLKWLPLYEQSFLLPSPQEHSQRQKSSLTTP